MGKFFKPWRRKIGVVMLVTACVFTGGWVRSVRTQETIQFRVSKKSVYFFVSNRNWLYWKCVRELYPSQMTYPQQNGALKIPFRSFYFVKRSTRYNQRNMLETETFEYSLVPQRSFLYGLKMDTWSAPYWSIIIPLILLSA